MAIVVRRRWRATAAVAFLIVLGLYHLMTVPKAPAVDEPTLPHDNPQREHLKIKPVWGAELEQNPVSSLRPLPSGKPVAISKIQVSSITESEEQMKERLRRLDTVKSSFAHSWKGYKENAWLRDEVIPIAGGFRDTFGGWAATLVDALDTLWIMGMEDEFEIAIDAVSGIDFTTTETDDINVFETTIRYLGGLLGAYDISDHKHPILLVKAIEVGEFLMGCFDTPNRMPITRWPWKNYVAGTAQVAPRSALVSEIGTLSLEFTRLSQLTGDLKYYDAVQRLSDAFEISQNSTKLPGMWPVVVNIDHVSFAEDSGFTLGGMSDSAYEYLPKQFMLLGGVLKQPRKLYENFIPVAKKHLFFKAVNPQNLDIAFAGDARVTGSGNPTLDPKMQHLTCFTGGLVAIGAKIFDRPDELDVARQLTDGCVWAYDVTAAGIGPEGFHVIPCKADSDCKWSDSAWPESITYLAPEKTTEEVLKHLEENRIPKGMTRVDDAKYILRPEAIESVFIMYRVTGDVTWQDKAWRMFEAIERACHTKIAYSAIADVTQSEPDWNDSMESFWLAETLKYFYLIFSDINVVSLDDYVLNTEAHTFKRPKR